MSDPASLCEKTAARTADLLEEDKDGMKFRGDFSPDLGV
jgi:hypothetical protein